MDQLSQLSDQVKVGFILKNGGRSAVPDCKFSHASHQVSDRKIPSSKHRAPDSEADALNEAMKQLRGFI